MIKFLNVSLEKVPSLQKLKICFKISKKGIYELSPPLEVAHLEVVSYQKD
jgi:hypothetical protein